MRRSPLQVLANNLAAVAFRRWIEHGMERAFRLGERDEEPRFEPLVWLREDRPRLRMTAGIEAFVVFPSAGGEESGENPLREAVPPTG